MMGKERRSFSVTHGKKWILTSQELSKEIGKYFRGEVIGGRWGGGRLARLPHYKREVTLPWGGTPIRGLRSRKKPEE